MNHPVFTYAGGISGAAVKVVATAPTHFTITTFVFLVLSALIGAVVAYFVNKCFDYLFKKLKR